MDAIVNRSNSNSCGLIKSHVISEFQTEGSQRSGIVKLSWGMRFSRKWVVGGLGLWGVFIYLAILSRQFPYERPLPSKPILTLVGAMFFAGVLYMLVLSWAESSRGGRGLLLWVIILGAAFRFTLLMSTPMLEDDYYRYLWDGAVVSKGINPYRFAPAQALKGQVGPDQSLSALKKIAVDSGKVAPRINHPEVRSIYPPVAQMSFALAYQLRPWSLVAWRVVLFGFDVLTLCLLILILRILTLPVLWITLYWWNPLLIKEIYNSGHMDVIVLPFVLAAVLFAIHRRYVWAGASLGLGVGAKVWPILLLPIILRRVISKPKKLTLSLGVFIISVGVMFFPVAASGFGSSSGFIAYGRSWENNDGVFRLILWGSQTLLWGLGIHPGYGQWMARLFVIALLVSGVIWLSWKNISAPKDLCKKTLFLIAALFLLSPTEFPWYYVWLIPFLTIRHRRSLLLLTTLLPLYYLRYWFDAHNMMQVFDNGIIWLEYLPTFYLLFREWQLDRQDVRHALKRLVV